MRHHWKRWVVASAFILGPTLAHGEVATVTIDRIAVHADGAHRVWLSLIDGLGRPLVGRRPEDFAVTEDLVPISAVRVTPYSRQYSRTEVIVIADPELFAGPSAQALASMLGGVRDNLSHHGQVRVVSAGGKFPSIDLTRGVEGVPIESRLGALGESSPPRILDATLRELGRSPNPLRRAGRVIIIVTRRGGAGEKAKLLDVKVALRDQDLPASISLILVGKGIPGRDKDRLERIALSSGGDAKSIPSLDGLRQAGLDLYERAVGGYLLRFRPDDWVPRVDSHSLSVRVRLDDGQASAEKQFVTSEVSVPPWWRVQLPWIATGLVLLALFAVVAQAARPRCMCRLVLESGAEVGCSYEILGVPITIGAMEGNDLILDEPSVSRNHAILDRRAGSFEILDLNSESGTFVNGTRVVRHGLHRGDRVGIGSIRLLFTGPR